MSSNKVIGIDIGGSHITAGMVNMKDYRLDESTVVRKAVHSQGDAMTIIQQWKDAISSVPGYDATDVKIGIAMPGPFNYPEGISFIKDQGKYQSLYELHVKEMLADALGIQVDQIHFENDAACFLQGEVASGAARSVKSAIGLTLGTGLGSSRYHGDFAQDAALWCSPFRGVIVEDYVSTRWFVKAYKERTGRSISEVRELTQNPENQGVAREIFREFGENLAEFLKIFIEKEQPEVIVIGGNITKAGELFIPVVQEELAKSNLSTPIRISELGESAALIGAASSWNQHQEKL
ncbi:ROK family protein [Echinicola marina]|uniref:ROK family protein n=1 Tax=Echinicola marina TaxID=2859768 RepID=UPI001CF6C778|nr:ROK family protein [Echinicola marina]UCS93088.1 ROK family protein [Echinicola marina]